MTIVNVLYLFNVENGIDRAVKILQNYLTNSKNKLTILTIIIIININYYFL